MCDRNTTYKYSPLLFVGRITHWDTSAKVLHYPVWLAGISQGLVVSGFEEAGVAGSGSVDWPVHGFHTKKDEAPQGWETDRRGHVRLHS